jgi:hypothetical protein
MSLPRLALALLALALLAAPSPMPSPPPDATPTTRGLVSTGAQKFGGLKTFDGGIQADIRPGSYFNGVPLCSATPAEGAVLTYSGGQWCWTAYVAPTYTWAAFEFAPGLQADGGGGTAGLGLGPDGGVGVACACLPTVYGLTTDGGVTTKTALTFTRASTATCTKGNTTASIANGDLVTCAAAQPRVMPGGDGTGGLGLLVESSRVNSLLQSQALDNAAWPTAQTAAPGLPTVTADFAVAPDGTTTAERFQFPATSAVQASYTSQLSCPGGAVPATGSVYLKGNGTSGTVDVCAGSIAVCSSCTYVAASWSRCTITTGANAGINTYYIGNFSAFNGGIARAANDVLLWGAQCEAGAYATSYIPTTTVAVTRAAETASFAGIALGTSGFSMAVSTTSTVASFPFASSGLLDYGAGEWQMTRNPSDPRLTRAGIGGTASGVSAASPARYACVRDSVGLTSYCCANGACNAPAAQAGAQTGSGVLALGVPLGSQPYPEGVLKQVCVDPSQSRSR